MEESKPILIMNPGRQDGINAQNNFFICTSFYRLKVRKQKGSLKDI